MDARRGVIWSISHLAALHEEMLQEHLLITAAAAALYKFAADAIWLQMFGASVI